MYGLIQTTREIKWFLAIIVTYNYIIITNIKSYQITEVL